MKSEFETKYIGIGRIHTPSDYGYEAKMYEKIHYYHCSICDISYTISELIEWKD